MVVMQNQYAIYRAELEHGPRTNLLQEHRKHVIVLVNRPQDTRFQDPEAHGCSLSFSVARKRGFGPKERDMPISKLGKSTATLETGVAPPTNRASFRRGSAHRQRTRDDCDGPGRRVQWNRTIHLPERGVSPPAPSVPLSTLGCIIAPQVRRLSSWHRIGRLESGQRGGINIAFPMCAQQPLIHQDSQFDVQVPAISSQPKIGRGIS